MVTGWPVIVIAVVAIPVCRSLSRQFMAYGRGKQSTLGFLEGRYFLGMLAIAAIGAVVSAAVTFLFGFSLTAFAVLTAAFCVSGVLMLAVGSQRGMR